MTNGSENNLDARMTSDTAAAGASTSHRLAGSKEITRPSYLTAALCRRESSRTCPPIRRTTSMVHSQDERKNPGDTIEPAFDSSFCPLLPHVSRPTRRDPTELASNVRVESRRRPNRLEPGHPRLVGNLAAGPACRRDCHHGRGPRGERDQSGKLTWRALSSVGGQPVMSSIMASIWRPIASRRPRTPYAWA